MVPNPQATMIHIFLNASRLRSSTLPLGPSLTISPSAVQLPLLLTSPIPTPTALSSKDVAAYGGVVLPFTTFLFGRSLVSIVHMFLKETTATMIAKQI